MNGPGLVVADGEVGLGDHALEGPLGDADAAGGVHRGQLRVILGGGAHDLVVGHGALDPRHVVGVCGDADDIVRQLADNIAEQTGVEHDTARLGDVGRQRGGDPDLHIVAGDPHETSRRLDEQSFQRGHGALLGRCPGGRVQCVLKDVLFTGEFHKSSS